MVQISALFASLFVGGASAATLYLVGDSTMALSASTIQGWGVPATQYFTNITLVNRAVGGESARSYTRDGLWYNTRALFKSGDYVILEFGHNDGGGPTASEKGDTVGTGSETTTVTLANGTTEVVQTYNTYFTAFINDALARGVTPIVSSATPNNIFETTDTPTYVENRFTTYARTVATTKNVPFVDHAYSTFLYWQKLGAATVKGYFPIDHTHTNAAGANSVAYAFMSGLRCTSAKSVLSTFVSAAGATAGARCPA